MCFALILAICACEEQDCCVPRVDEDWLGTWLLVEYGYSPGAGYIVEPVNTIPAQTLSLEADGTLNSNIPEMQGFNFYRIFDDAQGSSQVLALFETDPGVDAQLEQSNRTYTLSSESPGLRLFFRFCIEGCHLGFVGPSR